MEVEARAATARAMQMEPNTPPERAAACEAPETLQVPVTVYVQSGEMLTCPL